MCSKALLKGAFILPFPYCRRKRTGISGVGDKPR
nr:MAG TPA: hypothetical protein [Caudoviricetes sp.]